MTKKKEQEIDALFEGLLKELTELDRVLLLLKLKVLRLKVEVRMNQRKQDNT